MPSRLVADEVRASKYRVAEEERREGVRYEAIARRKGVREEDTTQQVGRDDWERNRRMRLSIFSILLTVGVGNVTGVRSVWERRHGDNGPYLTGLVETTAGQFKIE